MSFQTEIKKLYKEVNIRNQNFYDEYSNKEYAKYHIFKISSNKIFEIDEQNEQYIAKFQEIANKYNQSINILRGFKNRLFKCNYRENIIVRINAEVNKSSVEMTYADIKLWIDKTAKIIEAEYESEIKEEINKLNLLHDQMQKDKYRVHLHSGESYRVVIQDRESFEMYSRMNILKLSGLLLLNKENVEIIEQADTIRKTRKDKKNAILSLVIGKYSLHIIG